MKATGTEEGAGNREFGIRPSRTDDGTSPVGH